MPTEEKKPNETQEQFSLRLSIIEKSLELMTGAFALVAALAWNDAIQTGFQRIFGQQSSFWAKLLYALIVTGIVVYIGYRLSQIHNKITKKANGQKQ